MSSTARPGPLRMMTPTTTRNRIPQLLVAVTVTLAGAAAIPTGLLGGAHALGMMGLGAALGLVSVLGGCWIARFAFRGPDVFATKLVVGGFIIRIALLVLAMSALVAVTGIELGRFVLWLVTFYFALILAEAWVLARESRNSEEGSTR